jgi:hypothetical protein
MPLSVYPNNPEPVTIIVPLVAGTVTTLFPATFGTISVTEPEVEPSS